MSKQAVQFVTSGTYQRDIVYQDSIQWAAGTEDEVDQVATSIAGSGTEDTMYSWIRGKIYINNNSGEHMCYEWALIKCQSADAMQDLNDAAAMEKLMRESRIFGRDIWACGATRTSLKPVKFELYQVKLQVGEELRLVVRPVVGSAAGSVGYMGLIEYRKVGS